MCGYCAFKVWNILYGRLKRHVSWQSVAAEPGLETETKIK